jgi:membrane fusion protein (multidrug efflux system)
MRSSSFQISADTYSKAKNDYAKLKELQQSGNASGAEVENAKLQMQNAASQLNISKKQVGQTLVPAPESGTIIDKKINQGEYVTPGTTLGTMACLDEVLVNVFVQENQVALLKKGTSVIVRTDVYPGVNYMGKISAIIPVASAAKTFPVEIRIVNNKPQKLLAGMNASVIFGEDKKSTALVIPRSALTGNKKQAAVYLIHQSRHAVFTPIVLGKEYDTYLGVSGGLKAGDTVMTSGLLNVEPGKKIQWLTVQQ